jgi:S-adenosylmethionine:tRNA ribosyltransferase-isomerase
MSHKLDPLKVDSYTYELPKELIALKPSYPKGEGKLLVYKRSSKEIIHTKFSNIFDFIPKDTNIVLNNTKVIKARIFGNKSSGGKVELLLNSPKQNGEFSCYIKGRVKIGSRLIFQDGLSAKVTKLYKDGLRVVKFYQDNRLLDFEQLEKILSHIGHTPLPPYIKREDELRDEIDYQTLFAKHKGSVAAPTASLHFDKSSFERLNTLYDIYYLTLHIGAGTFKSVEAKSIDNHTIHSEWYNIPTKTKELIESKNPILAVGTTVTRAIEYYIKEHKDYGECDLFLNPINRPKRVDYLLTNFHLPRSTLIMLVASFTSLQDILKIYSEAIKHRYKFYSYGDSMLVI